MLVKILLILTAIPASHSTFLDIPKDLSNSIRAPSVLGPALKPRAAERLREGASKSQAGKPHRVFSSNIIRPAAPSVPAASAQPFRRKPKSPEANSSGLQGIRAAIPVLDDRDGLHLAGEKDDSIRWFLQKHADPSKAVALSIHGLNFNPEKMGAIIKELNASEIDVLNVSLYGHGENYTRRENMAGDAARLESFKTASYQLWKAEAYQAYLRAQKRSRQNGVPLFFVGYSLGGLLGLDLLTSNPQVRFEKTVLFAPAIEMHAINYLVKLLSPFPRLVIPSYTVEAYRANNGTPVAAYLAFFESLSHFKKHAGPLLNIPTLIFLDKRDELISFLGTEKMISAKNLSQWELYPVEKQAVSGPARRHHLIIDETTTGEAVWQKMMTAIRQHFFE